MGAGLQADMRTGFLGLAAEFPDRFRIINGGQHMDMVAVDILKCVRGALT